MCKSDAERLSPGGSEQIKASVLKQWYFSGLLLLGYLAVFLYWQHAPSRAGFVVGGLLVASVMSGLLVLAARQRYFASRADLMVHALVVVDILLEALAFEILLATNQDVSATAPTMVLRFHSNDNFYACAAVFAVLIGAHRWWALRRSRSPTSP